MKIKCPICGKETEAIEAELEIGLALCNSCKNIIDLGEEEK